MTPKELPEEIFDDDDLDLELGEDSDDLGAIPVARDLVTPMPALRTHTEQMVKVGKDGKEGEGDGDENDDEMVVLLRDPEGLVDKPLVLSMWAYALSTFFDGKRNAREVSEAFMLKFGHPVPPERALELQHELDRALFLYSTTFEETIRKQLRGYLNLETRPASQAGQGYPVNAQQLQQTVESFFTSLDGPGAVDDVVKTTVIRTLPTESGSRPKVRMPRANDKVRGMILPHIDLRVGGATYAHGYAELMNRCEADLFVILGVAHQSPGNGLYYVSTKDFATPLGVVKTEKNIARKLQDVAECDPENAELAHRTEHSIEFQTVMLQALLAQRQNRDFEIVPVLCGSIDSFLLDETSPLDSAAFTTFARHLRKELDDSGRRWCILSSVDLSHVGPEFHHSTMMTERLLPPVERADRKMLKILESLDPEAFYKEIARTQNSRHVDAVLAVLTMLEVCKGIFKSARLLQYDQMFKEGTHSAVSYASMVFEE